MRHDRLFLTEMIDAARAAIALIGSRSTEDIPIATRNRIVHGYWSMDLGVLHTTALHDLAAFVVGLERILDSLV